MRKVLVVALVALGGIAVGHGITSGAGASGRFGSTFEVQETPGTIVDEATHTMPDFSKPIPPGDTLAFRSDLVDAHHTKLGGARGVCTNVFETKFECNVTFTVTGSGSLALQALFDIANPSGDYAVTGGTGVFAGKHGWGHYDTLATGYEVHTLHITG